MRVYQISEMRASAPVKTETVVSLVSSLVNHPAVISFRYKEGWMSAFVTVDCSDLYEGKPKVCVSEYAMMGSAIVTGPSPKYYLVDSASIGTHPIPADTINDFVKGISELAEANEWHMWGY